MDNPEAIELFESELSFLINKAHKELGYRHILRIILERCSIVLMKSEAEELLGGKNG